MIHPLPVLAGPFAKRCPGRGRSDLVGRPLRERGWFHQWWLVEMDGEGWGLMVIDMVDMG